MTGWVAGTFCTAYRTPPVSGQMVGGRWGWVKFSNFWLAVYSKVAHFPFLMNHQPSQTKSTSLDVLPLQPHLICVIYILWTWNNSAIF